MMRKLLYSFLLLFFYYSSFAQIVFTDNTSGTRSWVVPQGATEVTVEIWGAGGAGGGSRNNNVGGSGGGGGGYSLKTFSVTAGQNINYTIGSGGTGSTGNGTAGSATSLTYTASNSLVANGGGRGLQDNDTTAGGAGGTATGGSTNLRGTNGSDSSTIGGNGGNSGNTSNTGGIGRANANGENGIIPGGGGGGGERNGNSNRSGGDGANGQVRITYTPSYQYQIISSNTGSATWCAGETRNVSVTIKNTGSKAWTDTPSSDFNIGIKWNTNGTSWTDYNVRVDAGNLAPGDTKTYTFTITAANSGGATNGTPLAAGINNLTFDVVYELVAWFGDNHSGVGPGNAVLKTGDQTIVATPANKTITATASTVCSGSGTTITVANSEVGVNYQLRNASNGNVGTPVAGSGGIISLPTGNLTTDTTFNVLATLTCGNSAQMTGTATVNVSQLPTSANAGPDQTGNSAFFTLAANAPTVGTGAWSVASGPNTSVGQFNSVSSPTSRFTPAVSGTYVLNWTVSNGSCTSTDQVIISTCISNLIKNGDFSRGTADWSRATTKGSYVEVYDESVYFGNSNNDITAELDSQASLGQSVTVVPGVPYTLSFLYARRPGSSPTTALDFKIIDGSNTTLRSFTTNDTTNTPVFVSFPFTPTSSSIWIEFYNSIETTTLGSIIDNIVLVPSSQVVPIATTTPKGNYKTLDACEGVPIQLDVENVPASGVTYSWTSTTPGVTFSSTTDKNPRITCSGTGIKNATVVVTTAGGCSSTASTTYVNIKAAPTVYNVTGGGSYCVGGTGVAVGLSNSTTGVSYQLKLDGNNSGSPMSGTTGSAINFGLKTTAGTYTVVATNASPNSCALNMNGSAVITVDPVSVGGSISGSTTVCSGTNSTTLTLSGHTGLVTKWQSSPSNTFSPVTDIPNSANTSLTVANLTATTYYRAVVKSGACSSADSGTGTITVNPRPAAPSITKNNDASCNTLGSIEITGLSGSGSVNRTGATTLPKSYPVSGTTLLIEDLAADTYSFTVTNDLNCTSSSATPVTITDTSSNTDWGPAGWTNGEPDGSKSVTISSLANGQPFSLAKPNITACSLTITVGSDVIIPSGVTLEITNKVTSNGKLVFESGSSLIQSTNVQNTGDIVYKRETKIRRFDLTYWSSPITSTKQDGFMMKDLSPETLFDKYSYWSSDFKWATALYGNMEMKPGIGYSIRGPQSYSNDAPADFTGKFLGIPNNGEVPISTTADKYLLIGNPYPSAIDGRKFITDNGDVGALYFWTHVSLPKKADGSNTYRYSSPDYAVFTLLGATRATTGGETPSGYIGVGQGFFIKPKVTSIKFNNGQRVKAENSQFFKTTAKEAAVEVNRLWLNLSNTEDAYKQILIGYAEGATNSFDYNYDAVTLAGNTYVDFYTINEAQKLSIQARSLPFDNTERIPLGYKSVAETQLTISIDHADGFFGQQAVYLEDKTTGIITDLRSSNYTFKTAIGTFTDRFVLRYTNKTLGTGDFDNLENSVLVSVKNKIVSITSSKEIIKEVNVFDVGAQLLYNKNKVNSSELQIANLRSSDQVLLVKITLENGSTITKKAIFSNL